MNIHRSKQEHDEALNAAEDNGSTDFFEELDKLSQILEDKKVILMIQKKDNDMLSLSEKSLFVFYHEETGFQTSRGKGKH